MHSHRRVPSRQDAEHIAINALSFLAGDPQRLSRFLSLTGIGPEKLRAAAAEPGFLAGVLSHVMSDESLLMCFAAEQGVDPAALAPALERLSGQTDTRLGE